MLLDRARAAAPASPADRALDLARDARSAVGHRLGALDASLTRAGIPGWAAAAGGAALLVLGVVIWTLARPSTSDEQSAMAPASTAAGHVESVHVTPGASAKAGGDRPVSIEVDGRDAVAWKKQLLAATESQDWSRAGKATEALVEIDPPAFREGKVVGAVMSTAVALEIPGGKPADAVFEALRARLDARGLEILFEIVRSKGGTKGSKRAAAILDEPEVVARQPPPLRIAIELHRARCEDKPALFQRAAEEGDDRALTALRVLRETECSRRQRNGPCCFRDNDALAAAIKRLRERLGKPAPPLDD
jgi:serine/threonine-protein kinase